MGNLISLSDFSKSTTKKGSSNELIVYVKDLKENISNLNDNVKVVLNENNYLTKQNRCIQDEMIDAKRKYVQFEQKYLSLSKSYNRTKKFVSRNDNDDLGFEKRPIKTKKTGKKKCKASTPTKNNQLGNVAQRISMEWSDNEDDKLINNISNERATNIKLDKEIRKSGMEQQISNAPSKVNYHIAGCIDDYIDEYNAKEISFEKKRGKTH